MTTLTPDRFTTLPDERTLAATVAALEEHGFSVEVVDHLDSARRAVVPTPEEAPGAVLDRAHFEQAMGIRSLT